MRIAVVSDIHGNAVALEAVLADLQRSPADMVVCLGDAIRLKENLWSQSAPSATAPELFPKFPDKRQYSCTNLPNLS